MSEVKKWLLEIGLPGLERLSDEFESRGFTTRKSLEYLEDNDLDYIFESPKKLLLAEKRAITKELQKLQASANDLSNGNSRKQLDFGQQNQVTGIPPAHFPAQMAQTQSTKSPLDSRAAELAENVNLLEVQVMSAEQHVQQLKAEENSLQTVRGRICSVCHKVGHNKNTCQGSPCESHVYCQLKDKHPELKKEITEGQKIVTSLKKNLNHARQELEEFKCKLAKARGNFFSIMRPRLKQIDPIKYISRQALDKDLLVLQRALGKNIPPEADDWKLGHIIECYKRSCTSYYTTTETTPPGPPPATSQQQSSESSTAAVFASSSSTKAAGQIPCIVKNIQISNINQQPSSSQAAYRANNRFWPY